MGRELFGWPILFVLHAVSTGAFLILSLAAVIARPTFDAVLIGFCSAAFLAGVLGILVGFFRALAASRQFEISVVGVFFLGDNAVPTRIRNAFLAVLCIQTVVALAVAALGPFSPLAFSILMPQLGVGLMALHGGFLGVFPAKA